MTEQINFVKIFCLFGKNINIVAFYPTFPILNEMLLYPWSCDSMPKWGKLNLVFDKLMYFHFRYSL